MNAWKSMLAGAAPKPPAKAVFLVWKIAQGKPVDDKTLVAAYLDEDAAEKRCESEPCGDWSYCEVEEVPLS